MCWSRTLLQGLNILALLQIPLVLILSVPSITRADELPPTIKVRGEATVQAPVDHCVIELSIESRDKTALAAAQANQEKLSDLQEYLREQQVTSDNLKTSLIRVTPLYPASRSGGMGSSGKQQNNADDLFGAPSDANNRGPVGFLVWRRLEITITAIERFEETYVGLLGHGVTAIDGVTLKSKQLHQHQLKARQQAAANALESARAIADQYHTKIKSIQSVQDLGTGTSGGIGGYGGMGGLSEDPFGSDSRGSPHNSFAKHIDVSARVEVVFELIDHELEP